LKPLGREVITIADTYIDKASGEEVELPKEPISLKYVKQLAGMGKTHKEIAERCGTTKAYIDKILYEDRKKQQAEAEVPKRGRGRPKGSKNKRTLAEEKMLANWENSPASPMMREDKADLNRAAGWFVGQCWALGKTVDHNSIESMQEALEKYVMLCTQSGMPMLVKTCHLALGLNPGTVAAWRNGKYRSNDPRYKEFVQLMDAVVAAGIEAAGAAGSLDRVLTIWFEKAHFGLYEHQGLVVENADPLGEKKSAKEIADKYADILPEDN
jgi:hypothetical protein